MLSNSILLLLFDCDILVQACLTKMRSTVIFCFEHEILYNTQTHESYMTRMAHTIYLVH